MDTKKLQHNLTRGLFVIFLLLCSGLVINEVNFNSDGSTDADNWSIDAGGNANVTSVNLNNGSANITSAGNFEGQNYSSVNGYYADGTKVTKSVTKTICGDDSCDYVVSGDIDDEIQAAIDSLGTTQKTIIVRDVNAYLANVVNLTNNTRLVFESSTITLNNSRAYPNLIMFQAGSSGAGKHYSNIEIIGRNSIIDYNIKGQTHDCDSDRDNCSVIYFEEVDNYKIDGLTMKNGMSASIIVVGNEGIISNNRMLNGGNASIYCDGMWIGANNTRIYGNYIENVTDAGIAIGGDSNNNIVFGNTIDVAGRGIAIADNARETNVYGNTVVEAIFSAYWMTGNISMSDNLFAFSTAKNTPIGYLLENGTNTQIIAPIFVNVTTNIDDAGTNTTWFYINGARVITNRAFGVGTASPVLTSHIKGPSVAPASSGSTAQGVSRFEDASGVGLDLGSLGVSPWTFILQVHDVSNQAVNYPLSLQPNGGNTGFGTKSPTDIVDINATNIRIEQTGCTGNCDAGEIAWNTTHICVCTTTNTWKAALLS